MRRYRQSQPSMLETLSAFRDLVRFPDRQVWAAAVLASLFCVVYAMGLGGIALWFWSISSSLVGGVSPDTLAPAARVVVGVAWVVFFTVVFMTLLLRSFLPRPRLRRESDVDEVIKASEELLARIQSR